MKEYTGLINRLNEKSKIEFAAQLTKIKTIYVREEESKDNLRKFAYTIAE